MNTRLIAGALATALGFISIAICYLGSRNPREPKWAGEMIMGAFIVPLSLGSSVMGLMLMGESFLKNAAMLSALDTMVALGILAAGTAVILMLRIKKRVAAYDALRSTPEIIALQNKRRAAAKPDPPIKPLDRAA